MISSKPTTNKLQRGDTAVPTRLGALPYSSETSAGVCMFQAVSNFTASHPRARMDGKSTVDAWPVPKTCLAFRQSLFVDQSASVNDAAAVYDRRAASATISTGLCRTINESNRKIAH